MSDRVMHLSETEQVRRAADRAFLALKEVLGISRQPTSVWEVASAIAWCVAALERQPDAPQANSGSLYVIRRDKQTIQTGEWAYQVLVHVTEVFIHP